MVMTKGLVHSTLWFLSKQQKNRNLPMASNHEKNEHYQDQRGHVLNLVSDAIL